MAVLVWAKNIFYLVKLCRENLKTVFIDGKNVDLLEIAFKKLENNSYYIHQDNIFVSGIKDPDINIKRKYLKIIIDAKVAEEKAEKARKKAKLPVPKPRLFVKPSRKNGLLNFNATTFDTLFNLDNAPPTEIRVPPGLANFTLKNFKDLYKSDTDY